MRVVLGRFLAMAILGAGVGAIFVAAAPSSYGGHAAPCTGNVCVRASDCASPCGVCSSNRCY